MRWIVLWLILFLYGTEQNFDSGGSNFKLHNLFSIQSYSIIFQSHSINSQENPSSMCLCHLKNWSVYKLFIYFSKFVRFFFLFFLLIVGQMFQYRLSEKTTFSLKHYFDGSFTCYPIFGRVSPWGGRQCHRTFRRWSSWTPRPIRGRPRAGSRSCSSAPVGRRSLRSLTSSVAPFAPSHLFGMEKGDDFTFIRWIS